MKKNSPSEENRVRHMIAAIDAIQEFIRDHNRESFELDKMAISACLYQFAILGEASNHLDAQITEKYPYPWHKVRSFRNFILHEYFGIEMRVVWDTALEILPDLRNILESILEKEF